jgi:hypothetical protein
MEEGRYREALDRWGALSSLSADHPAAIEGQASAHEFLTAGALRARHYAEALRHAASAHSLRPEWPTARSWYELARYFCEQRKTLDEATGHSHPFYEIVAQLSRGEGADTDQLRACAQRLGFGGSPVRNAADLIDWNVGELLSRFQRGELETGPVPLQCEGWVGPLAVEFLLAGHPRPARELAGMAAPPDVPDGFELACELALAAQALGDGDISLSIEHLNAAADHAGGGERKESSHA